MADAAQMFLNREASVPGRPWILDRKKNTYLGRIYRMRSLQTLCALSAELQSQMQALSGMKTKEIDQGLAAGF